MRVFVGIFSFILISSVGAGCNKPESKNKVANDLAYTSTSRNNASESEGDEGYSEKAISSSEEDLEKDFVESTEREIKTSDTLNSKPQAEFIPIAYKVLEHLKLYQFDSLRKYIHPTRGVAFSPYAYIDSPVVVKRNIWNKLYEGDSILMWGYHDGSGDSIIMSFPDYFQSFVYCTDFLNNADTSVNKPYHYGNSLNNFNKFFPGAQYIDFHFKGTEQYQQMDWKTLRMGFVRQNRKWLLIALIHDEWTI